MCQLVKFYFSEKKLYNKPTPIDLCWHFAEIICRTHVHYYYCQQNLILNIKISQNYVLTIVWSLIPKGLGCALTDPAVMWCEGWRCDPFCHVMMTWKNRKESLADPKIKKTECGVEARGCVCRWLQTGPRMVRQLFWILVPPLYLTLKCWQDKSIICLILCRLVTSSSC